MVPLDIDHIDPSIHPSYQLPYLFTKETLWEYEYPIQEEEKNVL